MVDSQLQIPQMSHNIAFLQIQPYIRNRANISEHKHLKHCNCYCIWNIALIEFAMMLWRTPIMNKTYSKYFGVFILQDQLCFNNTRELRFMSYMLMSSQFLLSYTWLRNCTKMMIYIWMCCRTDVLQQSQVSEWWKMRRGFSLSFIHVRMSTWLHGQILRTQCVDTLFPLCCLHNYVNVKRFSHSWKNLVF